MTGPLLEIPERFEGCVGVVREGWDAFFADLERSDNPHLPGIHRDAWFYGYAEAQDYGQ